MSLTDLLNFVPPPDQLEPRAFQDVLIHLKLVDGKSGFRWYVMAFDAPHRFHGIAAGRHAVVGDFDLSELEGLGEGAVLPDPEFRPTPLAEVARRDPAVARLLPPASDLVQLE